MKKKKPKHFFTLLEIMIVIFLIGIIGSVVGYNMKGSLEKGKVFRTQQAMEQIEDAITLQLASGKTSKKEIETNLIKVLRDVGIFKKPDDLAKDGWGCEFKVTVDEATGQIYIFSAKYDEYLKNK